MDKTKPMVSKVAPSNSVPVVVDLNTVETQADGLILSKTDGGSPKLLLLEDGVVYPVVCQDTVFPTLPAILRLRGNTLKTSPTGSIEEYVNVSVTPLTAPEPEYATTWSSSTDGFLSFLCKEDGDYKITCSGLLVNEVSSYTDYVGLGLFDNTNTILTGTAKTYNFGVSFFGDSSKAGFTLVGFGRFKSGDTLQLRLSSNSNRDLVLEDALFSFERLR